MCYRLLFTDFLQSVEVATVDLEAIHRTSARSVDTKIQGMTPTFDTASQSSSKSGQMVLRTV